MLLRAKGLIKEVQHCLDFGGKVYRLVGLNCVHAAALLAPLRRPRFVLRFFWQVSKPTAAGNTRIMHTTGTGIGFVEFMANAVRG